MSTSYSFQVVSSLLTGNTTDWTKTQAASGSHTEEFIASSVIVAGASDTALLLNLLTDPKVLVVIGGTGITFKLAAGGTDAIGADPVAVVSNAGDGLGIDRILLSNGDSQNHTVTVIAVE